MKTTIELPDMLFRRTKAAAVQEGITLKQLITDALQKRLRGEQQKKESNRPEWMRAYGALRHLRRDRKRLDRVVKAEFEQIESEDRA